MKINMMYHIIWGLIINFRVLILLNVSTIVHVTTHISMVLFHDILSNFIIKFYKSHFVALQREKKYIKISMFTKVLK